MLADRLMAKTDYDTDRELHTLELLKLRFGETSLHDCEIMLKVIACTSIHYITLAGSRELTGKSNAEHLAASATRRAQHVREASVASTA